MMEESEWVTVRVPKVLAVRARAIAAREMTQKSSVIRRALRVGLDSEEARLAAEDAARRVEVTA